MRNRMLAGNMLWALPFLFAATFGVNGCGDGSDTPTATPSPNSRTTLATDDFNRADNTEMGDEWDDGYSGTNSEAIVSQRVRATATNPSDPKSAVSYNAVMPANDQWCQITLAVWTGSEDREFGCILRAAAPPTVSWYWCYARANGVRNAAIVSHHPGGVGNINLASDFSVIWAAGDKLRCEAHGTTLLLFRIPAGTTAETLLLSASDTEFTSGRVGLLLWMFTDGDLSHAAIDDFSMGEF
jgi:hypothetical protein